MKRDTRREILVVAKRLFNQRGYDAVSAQDIAGALGISKGNLTYYFKKKEHIMEAILEESPGGPPQDAPKNFKELDDFLLDIQRVVGENAYYFWHHAQLSRLSPKIRGMQNKVYRINVSLLADAFDTFLREGLIRGEGFPGEYRCLIDMILLSGIYWLPFRALKQETTEGADYRNHAWSMLCPLLTGSGRAALRDLGGLSLGDLS